MTHSQCFFGVTLRWQGGRAGGEQTYRCSFSQGWDRHEGLMDSQGEGYNIAAVARRDWGNVVVVVSVILVVYVVAAVAPVAALVPSLCCTLP